METCLLSLGAASLSSVIGDVKSMICEKGTGTCRWIVGFLVDGKDGSRKRGPEEGPFSLTRSCCKPFDWENSGAEDFDLGWYEESGQELEGELNTALNLHG